MSHNLFHDKILLIILLFTTYAHGQVSFTLDLNDHEKEKEINQELIGVFFEDINYAADGGLYAEMVQNRSFEYFEVPNYVKLKSLHAWLLALEGGAIAAMEIEDKNPLNANNTRYLRVDISKPGKGVGIINSGFDGMVVEQGMGYIFSLFIRSESEFTEPITIKLTDSLGNELGKHSITNITAKWSKFTGTIRCTKSNNSANLVLETQGSGTLYFDMVSLFPKATFKNRENGLRVDLAQAITDIKPKFVRFPGGCISHGCGLDNAYRWKETIGKPEERKPNWNTWGYHQTYGLGFFEFFQFCEDIGAIPLPVVPVGISCQFRGREIVPLNEMQPWIDDALDLVEFANGDTTTRWGKKRAEMGHPQPFNMEYICLGNEEDDIPEFRERFKLIDEALKRRYPEIKIIGTSGTAADGTHYTGLWEFSRQEQIHAVDEHYYVDPTWLLANNKRYDGFDRKGPKVFVGEYASWGDKLQNAIAEAAFLTGIERNGDIVQFSCYAPLLCHEDHNQWNPDLIRFNKNTVVKTANYYVQQLYSIYGGQKYINSTIEFNSNFNPFQDIYKGQIGVGSWNTQVQYDEVLVVSNVNKVVSEVFSSNSANWKVLNGTFSVSEGLYLQSSLDQPATSLCNQSIDNDEYVYSLRARKTNGTEGFLVLFGFKSSHDYYWLNLGGWNNTQHAIEKVTANGKAKMISIQGAIQNNVWYDIKIEVNKSTATIYLNNEILFKIPAPDAPVTASVVKNETTNEVIVKLVNSANSNIDVDLNLKGLSQTGPAKVITLSGEPQQRNSIENPELIEPVESMLQIKERFTYSLKANSLTIMVITCDEK